jgi:two-component system response regulator LytT
MQETKIAIVEDEIIIADSIRSVLKSMHYAVPEPCCDYDEAIAMLHAERPDMVLLDINLGGDPDGIAVAQYIRDNMDIPFIFLTANSDAATVARAKVVRPNAFLVKPFQHDDLYTAIEIAMHNFYSTDYGAGKKSRDHVFIKDNGLFQKVNYDEILYLQSEHVYVNVYTTKRKYLVRTSLQQYQDELDEAVFMRIHRSYIVNKNKIENTDGSNVIIGDVKLPVSQKYKDALLNGL